jgi:hypothetical protein
LSVKLRALVGVYGASKFLAAALSGDMASEEEIERRRSICRDCPRRVRKAALPGMSESDWCGEPLVHTKTTCGCVIAAKTLVQSEVCPSGKW